MLCYVMLCYFIGSGGVYGSVSRVTLYTRNGGAAVGRYSEKKENEGCTLVSARMSKRRGDTARPANQNAHGVVVGERRSVGN